ncbi:hypothetical protein ACHAXA_005803 [Cyclostephanos tholiformis]|uniref:Major facilitator superfamily (MFS) profile domain-containing protein n=1 Tax=Cyclostephanos tholiformis TaxID=382380 RepID=A0ABD3RB37_9STRA
MTSASAAAAKAKAKAFPRRIENATMVDHVGGDEDRDSMTSDNDHDGYEYDRGDSDEYDVVISSRPPSPSMAGPRRRLSSPSVSLFANSPHLSILPVLLLEFLSLSLTRAVLPSLLLDRYGSRTYVIVGCAECVRGALAFVSCPLLGKLSDVHGRGPCLLFTVFGTLMPVCSLALWGIWDHRSWGGGMGWGGVDDDDDDDDNDYDGRFHRTLVASMSETAAMGEDGEAFFSSSSSGGRGVENDADAPSGIHRIDLFVVLLALSGVCSSTFTLTFAYISDVVKDRDGRVAAYGMALATFGLSFTIGPLVGGYLANVDDAGRGLGGRDRSAIAAAADVGGGANVDGSNNSEIHALGQHRVFLTSFVLALLDLFYIHFLLPESLNSSHEIGDSRCDASRLLDVSLNGGRHIRQEEEDNDEVDVELPSMAVAASSGTSNAPLAGAMGMGGGASSRRASSRRWNPLDSIRYLSTDPVLSAVGRVTFLYYTALHAVVSTLVLYATRRFHLGPQRLGELMAALGLSTMLSEAVLVRIAIPLLGERRCMRIGLVSFSLQCVLLAVADSPWHLFGCAFLAIAGNLVYPSVSSLVSSTVRPDMVGRALGAVNGVKSLTEGIGPLLFGTLLTMSEKDRLPGWPYFGAAIMVAIALHVCRELPDENYFENARLRKNHTCFMDESVGLMDGPRKEDNNDS